MIPAHLRLLICFVVFDFVIAVFEPGLVHCLVSEFALKLVGFGYLNMSFSVFGMVAVIAGQVVVEVEVVVQVQLDVELHRLIKASCQ
jgi:hypothetical protein